MAEAGATLLDTVDFVLENCFAGGDSAEPFPLAGELTRTMESRWYAAWQRHPGRTTCHNGHSIALPSRDATELVRSWMPWALQSLRDDLDTANRCLNIGSTEAEIAPGRDAEVLVDVV